MEKHYLEAIVVGIITAVVATAAGIGDRGMGSVATPAAISAPTALARQPLEAGVRRDQ